MGLFKKKPTVQPEDFLALRLELQDVRARLDASEQEKAIIESRLASLDASTTALAGGASPDIAEINGKIRHLEEQFAGPRIAPDDDTSPDGVRLDSVASDLTLRLADLEERLVATSDLGSKVAELEAQLAGTPHGEGSTGPDLAPKLAELEEQIANVTRKLDTSDLNRPLLPTPAFGVPLTGAPSDVPPPPAALDADAIARIDELSHRVAAVDEFAAQLSQLNARVSAQAEFGAQLSALRDRITQVQESASTDDLRARLDELASRPVAATPEPDEAATAQLTELAEKVAAADALRGELADLSARVAATDELRSEIAQLTERLAAAETATTAPRDETPGAAAPAANEELAAQVSELAEKVAASDDLSNRLAQLAERVAASDVEARQARELVAATEERLSNISTELANQLSELGRDIDSLARHEESAGAGDGAVTGEVIEALRSGQVKLANEQARYEIAFRQDLATLAEQVRKATGR